MRKEYFRDYLYDRRLTAALCLASTGIFPLLCALYGVPDREPYVYGLVLSLFLWGCAGCVDCFRYCKRRERVALAIRYPEQADRVFACAGEADADAETADQPGEAVPYVNAAGASSRMERCYGELAAGLCRERERILNQWEAQKEERSDYYLMWAHQIKTPIAALKLLAEGRDDRLLLARELCKVEQYAEMALQYQRLESIASDLLLRESSLYEMVKQSVRKFSVLFIGSGVRLELAPFPGVNIVTDEKWFGFCLEQILSNSIKYTKNGRVAVYLLPDAPLTLAVEDTGIGIRKEDLPRIFERGFTGYNGRMDRKATGIGLYLTKRVLDTLGIPIRVESEPGKGTRVLLELGELAGEGRTGAFADAGASCRRDGA